MLEREREKKKKKIPKVAGKGEKNLINSNKR